MPGPWTHLLTQTITVADQTGESGYGDPTFGTQYTLRARVEFGTELLRDTDGNETQSMAAVTTEVEIPRTSRVWLPGDDISEAGAGRTAITVKSAPLPRGTFLYETRF